MGTDGRGGMHWAAAVIRAPEDDFLVGNDLDECLAGPKLLAKGGDIPLAGVGICA